MTKITLTDLVNLENQTTAVNAINTNNNIIELAFDNTLSRDGTSPNMMGANLDMNSNRILNLATPLSLTEPLRVQDAATLTAGGTITVTGNPGGSNTQLQYNNSSVFGGISGATSNGTTVTLTSPIINTADVRGVWTTGTSWTLPALSLGGTISGGGNQINNVIVGNVTPLAGTFTALTATTFNKVTINAPATGATINMNNNKTLTINNTLQLAGTDGTTMTFPTTSATLARTDAANVFTGSGVILKVSANSSSTPPAIAGAFGTVASLIGSDTTRPAFSIQGFGAAAEPSILLMHARGTGAAPTATLSGDFVAEVFAHPYATTASAGYVNNAGSGFVFVTTEDITTTTAGQGIDIYTTPTGTGTTAFNSRFNATGGLSIGKVPTTLSGLLTVSRNATSPPVAGSGTPLIHLIGVDGGSASIAMQSFVTGGGNGVSGYSARGTQASPTAVQTNDILFSNNGYGYATSGGAGYLTGAGGGFFIQASENYTSSAAGSKVVIVTTPNGTASFANAATFQNSGCLSVGTASDYGLGNIVAAGGFASAAPTTKTANYTMTVADSSLIFNGAGSLTLTTLAAATYPGRELLIKTIAAQTVVSATSNVIPQAGGAAGTAILAATAGKWALLKSDGTNWQIMASN